MAKRPASAGSGETPLGSVPNRTSGVGVTTAKSSSNRKASLPAGSSSSLGRNVFAFGLEGRYLFNSQTQRAYGNLPRKLQKLFDDNLVGAIYSAAFGKGETYFISYRNKITGPVRDWQNVPSRLENWLKQERQHPRVSFGPDDSFFAWDQNGCCWQDLPDELETIIQKWLSAPTVSAGQTPFKWVSLGMKGSFVTISNYSIMQHNVTKWYPRLDSQLRSLNPPPPKQFSTESAFSTWLSPFQNVWVLVNNEKRWFYSGGDLLVSRAINIDLPFIGYSITYPNRIKIIKPILDGFKIADVITFWRGAETSMQELGKQVGKAEKEAAEKADKTVREALEKAERVQREAIERAEREARGKAEKAAREAKAKAERETRENYEREQRDKAAREERDTHAKKRKTEPSEIDILYRGWVFACENAARNIRELEIFPSLPYWICTCTQCLSKKCAGPQNGGRVCKHDIEKVLRCDEAYSWAWLKQKRNMWHSDRWCQAPAEHREEFKRQAENMFIIYGQLMDDLKAR